MSHVCLAVDLQLYEHCKQFCFIFLFEIMSYARPDAVSQTPAIS
jgi:hypothetical protein